MQFNFFKLEVELPAKVFNILNTVVEVESMLSIWKVELIDKLFELLYMMLMLVVNYWLIIILHSLIENLYLYLLRVLIIYLCLELDCNKSISAYPDPKISTTVFNDDNNAVALFHRVGPDTFNEDNKAI